MTEYNRLFWNIKSKDRLKDGLKSQTVQSRLEAAVKHDSIDTASELISETLVEACKEAGLKARNSTKYMLLTGREVRMGKHCARGLEYTRGRRPRAVLKTKGTVFPIRTDLAR